MSHEFGVLVNTITILAQKSLRERIAIYLLVLHERYQTSQTSDGLIDLPREDFANIVGTSRESLSRQLKDFRSEGLIDIQGRKISLLDHQAIKRIIDSYF